jgi:hypothetical protein
MVDGSSDENWLMRTFGDLAWWLASRWLPDAMQLLPIFALEPIFGPDHQKCVRTT